MARRLLPIVALVLLAGLSGRPTQAVAPTRPGTDSVPLAALPRDVRPLRYSLTLTVDPTKPRFRGHDEISIDIAKPVTRIFLHGLGIAVTKAIVRLKGGRTVTAVYKQIDPSGVARLDFAGRVPAGKATLVFDYTAPFNPALSGLYKVMHAGIPYAVTQFEAIDARRMFPSFDEPGFKTPFDIVVNAPKNDAVIANTPVKSKNATGGGLIHWVFEPTEPLPTYLVALAVGPYDVVGAAPIPANKARAAPIPLRGVAAKGQGGEMRYALSLTPKAVTALESYFGIAYPFEKLDMIAVPDFSAGAMENAGAITFRERYLLMPPDAPLEQRRASLDVQAHELTHQWFGDLVTPAWWDDIWLNESFAAWNESKISAAVMPKGQFERETLRNGLAVMALDELASARQIHNPVKGPDDIENSFDGITYSKGAAVLAMFESYAGQDAWRAGIHTYLSKFARRNATAHQFIQTIADTTRRPEIVASFDSYIDQPGIPDLSVALNCRRGMASLSLTQSMYAQIGRTVPERQWTVPMCYSMPGGGTHCQMIGKTAEIALGKTCPAYVMPNAEGKGYYRFAYNAKGWRALIKAAPGMNPADQLTLFENMAAALRANQASAADLFTLVKMLAPNAQWDSIEAIARTLHGFRDRILTAKDIPAYADFIRTNFAPRLKSIGLAAKPGEDPAVTLERTALVTLLVEEGRDPETTATLATAAEAYLASGRKSLNGLPPDLVQEALRAAVVSKGTAFGDELLKAYLASRDDYFHRSVLYAVAGANDTSFLDRVFGMALTPKMHIGDVRYFYAYMGPEPVARGALWAWLKANYGALLKRVSKEEIGRAAGILSDACDKDARADAEAFFRPKVKDVPGLARRLNLTEENIDRCIAFRDAKAKEIQAALKAVK